MQTAGYRADIDGLRAIAVLLVVAFHAFPSYVRGGYVGVDIFFVISGFLITTIIQRSLDADDFSFARFYQRRIRRIFPALIIVLAACAAIGWFTLLPDEYAQLGRHMFGGAAFISNFTLWQESGYFDAAAASKPLLHLWSLGIEEQFYIAWPALLMLARKGRYALTSMVLIGSFAANVWMIGSDPVAAFYSPITRVWELMVGGVLARTAGAGVQVRAPHARALAGLLLIAGSVLLLTKESRYPGWWALLPTVGTYLIISAGPGAWLNRRVLSQRALVWFGLISYPLYLWHWPLLSFAGTQLSGGRIERICAIALAIALAWLTYELVERPLRSGRFNAWRALSVLMASVAALGLSIEASRGVPARFPSEIQPLARFEYDHRTAYRTGRCFLDSWQTHRDYAADCTAKADVLLWGDSFAAHLQPGLQSLAQREKFELGVLTASACPPVLGMQVAARPHCTATNDYVLSVIRAKRPATVVLAAWWQFYEGKGGRAGLDLHELTRTVETLRSSGVSHVVLFGQTPIWAIEQPKVSIRLWRKTGQLQTRTSEMLGRDAFEVNARLATHFRGAPVVFISPTDLLCNAGGCLLSADASGTTPMAWDSTHLTTAGSRRLVDEARPLLPARLARD